LNLIVKDQKSSHRGIVGVDAAILLIGFVIVAAGFAFVMVNMGFSSSQKSKTVIVSGLSSAGTGLQVSGKVLGAGYVNDARINVTGIPIKIASEGESVDLNKDFTAIKFQGANVKYDNIFRGFLKNPDGSTAIAGQNSIPIQPPSLEIATDEALSLGIIDENPYLGGNSPSLDDYPLETTAFVYWTVNVNGNEVLDSGEHAVIAIVFAEGDRPKSLEKFHVELIPYSGGSLTVERSVPVFINEVVWLG